MLKFFITGGAGFLGINLTRHLIEKGNTVISYDFSEEYDYPERNIGNVQVKRGDVRHIEPLIEAMKGCDIIVHAAAALPLYSKDDILTTDIDGTENVLKAATINGINRVIMISSTAVYGIPNHHPIFEEDRLVGVGPYGEAKIAAEAVCLKYREKGLCVPIIRPKSFIGPERLGVFSVLYNWAQEGRNFPMIGSGKNRYQLLDVFDLCEAILSCATLSEHVVNDTFNIGAEKFSTMKEDYQAVLDLAGFGKKVVGFPATPVILGLRALELLNLSPLYKWVYETAAKDSYVSIEKAKNALKYRPIYSNQDALCRNYQWYVTNMNSFSNKIGISHRTPWKQGLLRIFKAFF